MNERIKELAEQAGFSEDQYGLYWDEDSNTEGVDLEKFAELIVRECLVILNQNNPRPPGTVILYSMDQDRDFDTGWQVAVETKHSQIKKHFGVE